MWKNLYLRLPSNLTKCYSSPNLPPSAAAATSDDDNLCRPSVVVINKFNVNYNNVVDLPSSSITTATTTSSSATSSNESDDHHDVSPDLTAAFASRRFFFSSPGRSNSITDSPETRSRELFNNYDNANATSTKKNKKYEADSVTTTTTTRLLEAVKRHVYSPDPINDFKRSMQEMIDAAVVAGDLTHPDKGYEFLNELLMCYLSLNPIDTLLMCFLRHSCLAFVRRKTTSDMLTWHAT